MRPATGFWACAESCQCEPVSLRWGKPGRCRPWVGGVSHLRSHLWGRLLSLCTHLLGARCLLVSPAGGHLCSSAPGNPDFHSSSRGSVSHGHTGLVVGSRHSVPSREGCGRPSQKRFWKPLPAPAPAVRVTAASCLPVSSHVGSQTHACPCRASLGFLLVSFSSVLSPLFHAPLVASHPKLFSAGPSVCVHS